MWKIEGRVTVGREQVEQVLDRIETALRARGGYLVVRSEKAMTFEPAAWRRRWMTASPFDLADHGALSVTADGNGVKYRLSLQRTLIRCLVVALAIAAFYHLVVGGSLAVSLLCGVGAFLWLYGLNYFRLRNDAARFIAKTADRAGRPTRSMTRHAREFTASWRAPAPLVTPARRSSR